MIDVVKQALERGFARETEANIKYLIFAQKAEEEARSALPGQERELLKQVADLFRQVAEEEAGHALFYLRALDVLGDTSANLLAAAAGEQADTVEYAISAAAARADGEEEIAQGFERIATTEQRHNDLFRELSVRAQGPWLADRLR